MKNLKIALLSAICALITGALIAQAQVPGVNSTLNAVFTLAYDQSTMKPTYSASALVTLASAPTDVCTLNGSATKLVKVRRILVNGLATTAVTEPVAVIKRSTTDTAGVAVTLTTTSYDSSNPAGTAVAEAFTTNPGVGTVVGVLTETMLSFGNLTTGGAQTFGGQILYGHLGQPIVLRGVAQLVAVNLNAITESGGQITCTFEWTEE